MVNPLKVIIDSNMVDNFSEMNIDPVSAFANSGYTLYITKDVKREIEALIKLWINDWRRVMMLSGSGIIKKEN